MANTVEITRSGGGTSTSTWIWRCTAGCGVVGTDGWASAEDASRDYGETHHCEPCPVCSRPVRIVFWSSRGSHSWVIANHKRPGRAMLCHASARRLAEYRRNLAPRSETAESPANFA